jgi:hypothetical protein
MQRRKGLLLKKTGDKKDQEVIDVIKKTPGLGRGLIKLSVV